MNTFTNKALLLPITAGLILALAGCGGTQAAPSATEAAGSATTPATAASAAPLVAPDAKEIFPKVTETVRTAKSVAIVAELAVGSDQMKAKMSGTRDGSNSLLEVTRRGATSTVLSANGATYVKADKDFVAQDIGQAAADMVGSLAGSKWIAVTDTSKFNNPQVGSLLDSFSTDGLKESDFGKITDKSVVDLNGAKAFKYTAQEAILWIAAEGEPYLLQMSPQDPENSGVGTMTFNEWNSVAPQAAPSKAETVSVPGL